MGACLPRFLSLDTDIRTYIPRFCFVISSCSWNLFTIPPSSLSLCISSLCNMTIFSDVIWNCYSRLFDACGSRHLVQSSNLGAWDPVFDQFLYPKSQTSATLALCSTQHAPIADNSWPRSGTSNTALTSQHVLRHV